ncbi:MAG TPA: peptidase M28, partial [Sphingomicrobium sp.]
ENYNWQHQDLRTENGIKYGDTIENMDFPYLAKITKLNVAALAAIASAPPPPEPKVEGAVSTDTTVTWTAPITPGTQFRIHWRRTDANQWEVSRAASARCGTIIDPNVSTVPPPGQVFTCEEKLPHIRVDDWVFGVSSVSKDGFESPVASAVPGGAFKPYVASEKKP